MKRGRKVRVSESDLRDTLVENEVLSNNLFNNPDESIDALVDQEDDLNDLLRKLDNITDTFREENENPFYYFLNMYSH